MRRIGLLAMVVVLLAGAIPAGAVTRTFRFSEEDLWQHTPSANQALYTQEAPRRHHTVWKTDVQTTDSAQPNVQEYQRVVGKGTDGFPQTATFDTWMNLIGGGPLDNYGNAFGICDAQLWGANFPNSKYAWGERIKIADTGTAAWQIVLTPAGWTGEIIQNPWPDPGYTNPMYFVDWYADSYANRILYSAFGNGVDDYVFAFSVDIAGEYPTSLEPDPDGNPFEEDGRIRFWFGGTLMDPNSDWPGYAEGFDGIMTIPEPVSMTLLGLGGLALIRRRR